MSVTIAPRPSPRLPPTDSPPGDSVRAWLARLPADLPSFVPAALAPNESCTPAETHAVARAAACPDLFLIHAADPAAGERAIAQVAALAPGRVLVLSPDPAAADRLTERLAKVGVVRALADDENPIRPSPIVAKLTSTAVGPGKVEQLKREASEAAASAEASLAALDRLDRLDALDAEVAELTACRDRVEAELRAGLDGTELAKKEADLAALRHRHAEAAVGAGKRSGFFAWLFGRPKRHGPAPAEVEKQIHVLEAEVSALVVGRENAIRAELAIRNAALDERRAGLVLERDRARAGVGSVTRDDAQRELAAARDRAAELNAPDLASRLLAAPRVVVGTPGSLQADPVFGEPVAEGPPFALLVLDRSEELTEADFTRLAPLAGRWVLVGEALAREGSRPHRVAPLAGNGKPARNGRPAGLTFAARLAHLLDREPWAREADRLVCRLMHPMTASGRQALAREPLLDRPEIELRFAADASGEPVVAEVAFPAATTVADAKSFLFHQLGEVLLHPCGALQWDHTPTTLAVRWPAAEHATCEIVWIDLEPGVREKVAGIGLVAFTAAIEFDPAAGWDREKAEAWLAKHMPAESAGRFATVPADGAGKRR